MVLLVVPSAQGLLEEKVVALWSQPEHWVPGMGHPPLRGVVLGSGPSAQTFPFESRGPCSNNRCGRVFTLSKNTSPSPNTPLVQSALSAIPPRAGAALPSRDLTAPRSWRWGKLQPVCEAELGLFNAFGSAFTWAWVLRHGAMARSLLTAGCLGGVAWRCNAFS